MRKLLSLFPILFLPLWAQDFQEGLWRGILHVHDGHESLPFLLEIKNGQIEILNGEERITLEQSRVEGQTRLSFPLAHSYLEGKFVGNHQFKGFWVRPDKKPPEKISLLISQHVGGKFEIEPSSKKPHEFLSLLKIEEVLKFKIQIEERDQSPTDGILVLKIKNSLGPGTWGVLGTIRTQTGDYRYLEGTLGPESLKLSSFDGIYSFLLSASLSPFKEKIPVGLEGKIFSGKSSARNWKALLDPEAQLPDSFSLTRPKEKTSFMHEIAGKTKEGKLLDFKSAPFLDRPKIVQIFGSWCPNCLDEARFFSQWQKKTQNSIPLITVAFERADSEKSAWKHLEKVLNKIDLKTHVVLADFDGSQKPSKLFPQIENWIGYPITFFLNRKNEIIKVHTAFNGPATGEAYIQFQKEFEKIIADLEQN